MMSETQPTLCQSRLEQRLKNNSVNLGNPFDKDESSSTFESSEESLSSDNEDILTPLPLPILNHQRVRRRNIPAKTTSKNKERPYNSQLKKQKFPKYITPPVTQIMLPNTNTSTQIHHLPSKNVYMVHHFWGQPEDYFKSANESERLSSTYRSQSMKFHNNSKPSHCSSVPFNYPISDNYKIKSSNNNIFQEVNRLSCCCCCCCSTTLSKQAAFSNTHKLILHCIRNCQTPLNIYKALDIPTTPCQCRPYFQLLNAPISHSTLNNHPPLEELEKISTVSRSTTQFSTSPYPLFHISPIETSSKTTNFNSLNSTASSSIPQGLYSLDKTNLSPCSIGIQVESLETTLNDETRLPFKAELISNVQSISKASEFPCRESCDFQDEPEKINQSSGCSFNSYNFPLKGNSICQKSAAEDRCDLPSSMAIEVGSMETTPKNNTSLSSLCPLDSSFVPLNRNSLYSKSISERNWQNNKGLKSESSLKSSSISRVKKEDILRRDEPTSSNSTSLSTLGSNKYIQNASVGINQPLTHSDILCPTTRNSNDSRVTDLCLEENDHLNPQSNDLSFEPFLQPKQSFSLYVEEPFAPPNSPNLQLSPEEWCFTENTAGSNSQPFPTAGSNSQPFPTAGSNRQPFPTAGSNSQPFPSLSMMGRSPTEEISEVSIFKEPNSEHNSQSKKRKKTIKKAKFVSCFIACLRPPGTRKSDQT